MEVGIAKLLVQDDLFFKEDFSKSEKSSLKNYRFVQELIDWEKITISDFIDFIEFSDYRKFIIITNEKSKRLSNIIEFLSSKVDIELVLEDIKELSEDISFDFKMKDKQEILKMYNNSFFAINTGFYIQYESVHIKHIVTEDFKNLNNLDESILENLGFNSLVLVTNSKTLNDNSSLSKVMLYQDFLSLVDPISFENLSDQNIKELIINFENNGLINYRNKLISNFGRFLSKKQLSSLFIFNSNIYYDTNCQIKLSDNLQTNIYQLINSMNNIDVLNMYDDKYLRIFFVLHTIVEANKENLVFITPYNSYNYAPVKNLTSDFSSWIGYKDESKYYLYNLNNNKTFEVNETFINLFEKLIKEKDANNNEELKLISDIKEKLSNV